MNEIINNAFAYIKEFFKNDYSGHDYYHSFRVYNNAVKIAENEKIICNLDIVKLIALLHDIDDYKISPNTSIHLDNARNFLNKQNLDKKTINQILLDIKNLSFSKGIPSSFLSFEGKIVQDADRLDAIGAIGIARTFAYGGANNKMLYDPENKQDSTIKHFYDKLLKLEQLMNTEYAKTLANERTSFLKIFLNQFYKELNL